MPIVWEPVPEIRLREEAREDTVTQAVDGGIRNVSPLGDVIEEINKSGNDDYTVVIINCNSGILEEESYREANIAQIALRSLVDIATTEIFNNDVNEFLRINDILAQLHEAGVDLDIQNFNRLAGGRATTLKRFRAIVIQTDPGMLGDMLWSDADWNERRIRHGMEKAAVALGGRV